MTLEELIAAERVAVDNTVPGFDRAKRKRLYAKMRAFSEKVQRAPLPNDVDVRDATLQLYLRAKDLAGVSDPNGWYAR